MTKHPDKNAEDEAREPEDPEERFDELDERIQEGLQSDPRLDSGVAPGERSGDLDFIQMSGLTAPPPAQEEAPAPEETEDSSDLDPGKPLSFYEEGVADVDSSMVPSVGKSTPEREFPADPDNRAAMEHLRDMIAELTKDEGPAAPPPAEHELDSSEGVPQTQQPAETLDELAEAPEPSPTMPEDTPATPESTEAAPRIDAREPEAPLPDQAEAAPKPFELTLRDEEPEPRLPDQTEAAPKPFELTPRKEEPEPPAAPPEITETISSLGKIDALDSPETPGEWAALQEPPQDVEPPDAREPEIPEIREEQAPPLAEEPPSPRVYTPPPSMAPRGVLKAEPPASPGELGDRVQIPTVAEAEEAMYLRHSAPRTRRRRSGHRKHARRRLARIAAGFIVLIALAGGGYKTHAWYETNVSNPSMLYDDAVALAAQGKYREASSKFSAFAQRNPGSELRAEAQFAAAFVLQQVQPSSKDEATREYTRALELFQTFLDENPAHAKAPRARTLMGRLHYELGQYQQAIELLRDPELRLLDPIAAVPAVRLLARSYAKLGQDDSARSYYLQAVGLQDNHTPDVDYMELGALYRAMAERTSAAEARREYEQLAITQWMHAIQSPGIDPGAKKELRAKIDVLRERGLAGDEVTEDPSDAETAAEPLDRAASTEEPPWESLAPALEEDTDTASDELDPSRGAESDSPPPMEAAPPAEADVPQDDAPLELLEAAPPAEVVHQVVAGDTLSGIAAAYRVTAADLMAWNDLSQSVILVGQELIVRGAKSQASDPSNFTDENEEENRDSTS